MSQASDFVIQDGVLLEYRGPAGTVVVPKGVTGIPSHVFRGSKVKEVILPEGLVWLGDFAFSECQCLRRLVLPGTLRVVPHYMCHHSRILEEVVIPEGVVFLGCGAFHEAGLRSVTIPGSVRSIGSWCFYTCRQLKTVILEEGVKTLQLCAFDSCGNLRSVFLPDSLQSIQDSAFNDCPQLESIHMGRGLEVVGPHAFQKCRLLRDVEFPESLESIELDAFEGCSSLERVTFHGNRTGLYVSWFSANLQPEPILAPIIRAPRLCPGWIPVASRPAALKGYRELKAEGGPFAPEIMETREAGPFRIVDGILCGAACTEGRVVVPDGKIY